MLGLLNIDKYGSKSALNCPLERRRLARSMNSILLVLDGVVLAEFVLLVGVDDRDASESDASPIGVVVVVVLLSYGWSSWSEPSVVENVMRFIN